MGVNGKEVPLLHNCSKEVARFPKPLKKSFAYWAAGRYDAA
jgi:hypothetical protein